MSRYARKLDDNQKAIAAHFHRLGCEVRSTAALGNGFPDLAVLYLGRIRLIEVKDGRKVPSARRLTPLEVAFAERWPVELVECAEDATAAVSRWTRTP